MMESAALGQQLSSRRSYYREGDMAQMGDGDEEEGEEEEGGGCLHISSRHNKYIFI